MKTKSLRGATFGVVLASLFTMAPGPSPRAAEKPPPANFTFDPFHQNWNDRWRQKIGVYTVTIPRGQRIEPRNVRAFFGRDDLNSFKAKAARAPLTRIVHEIKSEPDKASLLSTFGEPERNKALSLFTSLIGNIPGMEALAWVQWFDELFGELPAARKVTTTRTTFSSIAAVGGKIVYQESLLEASDGRPLLTRGLFYTVTVGREVRVLPLNYERTLIEVSH